jgi:hypothetical protein
MSTLLQHTATFIQQDFQLEEQPPVLDKAQLLDFLTRLVEDLLERDLERLFWVLYRLDVDEQKAHAALSLNATAPPAPTLAQLIFQREQQKAYSRVHYKAPKENEDEDVTPW